MSDLVALKTQLPSINTKSAVDEYLDQYGSTRSIVGRMIKFDGKKGAYLLEKDKLGAGGEYIALMDSTLVGWVKFNGPGNPPDRVMGLVFDGWRMPSRESLGDLDESLWEVGFGEKPKDPWQHHNCVVLQSVESDELFTFVTSSATGRGAVQALMSEYRTMLRKHPDDLPVVRLDIGDFSHKKFGQIQKPQFTIVGRRPRDSAAKPDTSVAGDMDDEIPF